MCLAWTGHGSRAPIRYDDVFFFNTVHALGYQGGSALSTQAELPPFPLSSPRIMFSLFFGAGGDSCNASSCGRRRLRTAFGCLCHNVANVVLRVRPEDISQTLCTLHALGVQSIARSGLFAMTDQIDGRAGDSQVGQSQSDE